MKIKHDNIIGELERLAAAFPWNSVDIWARRTPEGEYSFVAYVNANMQVGIESDAFHGPSPSAVVDEAVKSAARFDPEITRQRKVEQLQQQIEKLQAVVIGLPPYRPNRELSNGEPAIKVNDTVNV